jgi:anaerobic selenocysteine-containing dehydrogenase
MATEIVYRSCPTCEASCGLRCEIDRANKRVLCIEGDPDDPRSRGYLCPKAFAMQEIYEDPHRLRLPIRKRSDGSWEELGFEEALSHAAERLREIRARHGNDAIGCYIGNPTGHNAGSMLFAQPFGQLLATPRSFSAGTMDQYPQNVALRCMLGDGWLFPIPDLDRTDFFVCMGGNPLVSQGSLMSAPNARERLRRLRARGAVVVVVDPRRTETAEIADQHLFIRPGSDAYFLLAVIRVLFDEGLVKPGRLAGVLDGVGALDALSRDYTPEAVAGVTGIDAQATRELARAFAQAPRAAWYTRIGLCTQEFGTLASAFAVGINALTGNLDREGGMMFPRPATGNSEPGPANPPMPVGRYRTVARGIPEIDGQLPCGLLAEEIEEASAGEKRMRALVTVCGNPVLSAPNGPRLAAALPELDFMLSVDIYLNETTRHADLIIPSTVQLEHENFDFLFQSTSIRNMARHSPACFEPEPGALEHGRILLEIAARVNGLSADQVEDGMLEQMLAGLAGGPNTRCPEVSLERARAALGAKRGAMRFIDLLIRTGPYGDRFDDSAPGLSLAKLRRAQHGVDLGALEPRLPEALKTPGRRIALLPDHLSVDLPRLAAGFEERKRAQGMVLVGRRQLRNMNSWLHNLPGLASGKNRCTLLVNAKDAERLALRDGAKARVRSRCGEVIAEVAVGDEMMPGVVSLPHGFGHAVAGTRLPVARDRQPGVCSNDLTDEFVLDVPSGTHVANGIPVTVEAA